MKQLRIDRERCVSCGACARACPFQMIHVEEGFPEVNQGCSLCGACVESCPAGAISLPEKEAVDLSGWKGILVFLQVEKGKIMPLSAEIAGIAQHLAGSSRDEIYGVCMGSGALPQELEQMGFNQIYYYDHECYRFFNCEAYRDALCDCIAALRPAVVLLGATPEARAIAPGTAVRFQTGLTADCTQLEMRDGNLIQVRPAFGGNLMAQIITKWSRPQMATVRGGMIKNTLRSGGKTEILHLKKPMQTGSKILNFLPQEEEMTIQQEKRLVAIGAGLARREDVAIIREFAQSIGAGLASSRALVERGWMPVSRQIGLSGSSVSCDLLITLGVSGSVQFLAGVQGAKKIIAVNSDPQARIFDVAHYGLVEDLYELVPALQREFENQI